MCQETFDTFANESLIKQKNIEIWKEEKEKGRDFLSRKTGRVKRYVCRPDQR